MLDGAARIDELLKSAAEMGMPAIATTDHGYVFGAYEFWSKARRYGIKPDHRRRGLPHAGYPPARQDPGPLGRRHGRPRRRRWWRRVHPHDPPGPHHRRHAQPLPDELAGLDGGPLLQAAHRPRAPVAVLRRTHRHHRVRGRGDPDAAAPRPVRPGPPGRRRAPGPVRQGELLRRGHGPRHPHRAADPARAAPPRQGSRHPAGRHQRPALHQGRGRQGPRGAPLRPVRLDHDGPRPVQVRRRGVLPQDARADAAPVPRAARGVRQHAAHRRALRRLVRRGRGPLHAAVPLPRGGERGVLVRQGGRARPPDPLPRRRSGVCVDAGEVRDRGHPRKGLPGVLPRRRRLHQLGQGQRDSRRTGPWLRCRLDVRLRAADHGPRPDPATASSSSGSSIPSARRCPTSTWTSTSAAAAR